jgi:hypothetical protein
MFPVRSADAAHNQQRGYFPNRLFERSISYQEGKFHDKK